MNADNGNIAPENKEPGEPGNKRSYAMPITIIMVVGLAITLFSGSGVFAVAKTYENLRLFSEALNIVQENYVRKVGSDKLIEGAIKGLLKNLDPHSSYLTLNDFKEMQVETDGEFGGIGIEITLKDDLVTIVAPIEGTPGEEADLRTDDKILAVDGEPLRDTELNDAVQKIRGPIGTYVTLTIFREGWKKTHEVKVRRAVIKVKSVKHDMIEPEMIGLVKIRTFSKTTSNDLDLALADLESRHMRGLIIDLRNNPGGLLNQAAEVSERFVGADNLLVYTHGRNQREDLTMKSKNTHPLVIPMVVLVNKGSASASEIVAGAMQDLGRAKLVGTKTFGKGSVQTIIPMSDGSGVRLTTALYYTPKGRLIHDTGIEPDLIVENPVADDRKAKDESEDNGKKAPEGKVPVIGAHPSDGTGDEKPEFAPPPKEETDDKVDTTDSLNGKSLIDRKKDKQLDAAIDLITSKKTFDGSNLTVALITEPPPFDPEAAEAAMSASAHGKKKKQ